VPIDTRAHSARRPHRRRGARAPDSSHGVARMQAV